MAKHDLVRYQGENGKTLILDLPSLSLFETEAEAVHALAVNGYGKVNIAKLAGFAGAFMSPDGASVLCRRSPSPAVLETFKHSRNSLIHVCESVAAWEAIGAKDSDLRIFGASKTIRAGKKDAPLDCEGLSPYDVRLVNERTSLVVDANDVSVSFQEHVLSSTIKLYCEAHEQPDRAPETKMIVLMERQMNGAIRYWTGSIPSSDHDIVYRICNIVSSLGLYNAFDVEDIVLDYRVGERIAERVQYNAFG